MGEDPSAPNWDPERKLIRSPINGSRGPRFENSAEDWVTHRPVLADYPLPYDDIPNVSDSSAWLDDDATEWDLSFGALIATGNSRAFALNGGSNFLLRRGRHQCGRCPRCATPCG